ncbi:hypothetical protein [Paenibacillus sp. FSL H7-689]|uniref:hypothetical protein n=1 Tax=Paenibacillus sp. FSL H7-689 TaxID=1227349 RepID=UPI0003E28D8B|nr:hypothetical protein [Paenibacillus sp. FSL H7-689]ETT44733.1 hypothetical protein C170_22565 [Paenibacillus sp. FSL H7-689]
MNKKVCILLSASIIAASLLTPAISAQQQHPAESTSSKAELVTIAKKTSSTKKEKIAYYQKKIGQLEAQIDKLEIELSKYAISSKEYRRNLGKQNSLLEKKLYWIQKIIDLK